MQEYSYEFKLPKERIAIAIGVRGKIKKEVEKLTKCFIMIDSKEGDVSITGTDMLGIHLAKEILNAIGRGFNPEIALTLVQPENMFEQISLHTFAKTKNHLLRVRGRLIGTDGRTRKLIEELSECNLCIFGKTVGIIGDVEMIPLARRAVQMLVKGSQQHTVYSWLEKQRRILKERRMREVFS